MSTKKAYVIFKMAKSESWVSWHNKLAIIGHDFDIRQNCLSLIFYVDLTDAEEVYSSIIKDFPTYLTAHISLIQKLELAEAKNALPFTYAQSLKKTNDLDTTKATLERVVDLANVVIKETNVDSLLAYYGLKTDNRLDAAKIKT